MRIETLRQIIDRVGFLEGETVNRFALKTGVMFVQIWLRVGLIAGLLDNRILVLKQTPFGPS